MALILSYSGRLQSKASKEDLLKTLHDLAEAASWEHQHVESATKKGLVLFVHEELALPFVMDKENVFLNPAKRKDKYHIAVDTQRAGLEAHKNAVALLDLVQKKFAPSLSVQDDSGYFLHRDENILRRHMESVKETLRLVVRRLRQQRRLARLLPEELLVNALFTVIRTPEDLKAATTPMRMSKMEAEVLREQEATLFSSDPAMKALFDGKFEEYWQALRNPSYMERRLAEREEEMLNLLAQNGRSGELEHIARYAQDAAHLSLAELTGTGVSEPERGLEKEPLFQAADSFARITHDLTGELYYDKRQKTKHVFRAHINSVFVPAKIAHAYHANDVLSPSAEQEELSLLRQSRTFLRRTLESLQAMNQESSFANLSPVLGLLVRKGVTIMRGIEERIAREQGKE